MPDDPKQVRANEIDHAVASADRAKQDAVMMQTMDTIANGMTKLISDLGTVTERLDALEAQKPPAAEEKKPVGEKVVDKTRTDPNEERMALADAQVKCDAVAQCFGQQAPPPMAGELSFDYRRRLARAYQSYSKDFAKTDLVNCGADTFPGIEARIYADARVAADAKIEVSGNKLYQRTRKLDSGHTVNEFYGSPGAWMDGFAGQRQMAYGSFKTGVRALG